MAAQAAIEGRFLGGRPPYGYRLVDAGPHPNPAKAATGRRLHRLAPDPIAAPVVQRIFAEYLDGRGPARASPTGLNARRHPLARPRTTPPATATARRARRGPSPPSAPSCTNPRYTGLEVWNKQRKDEVLLDVDDVAPRPRDQDALERHVGVDLVARARRTRRSSPRDLRSRASDVRPRSARTHSPNADAGPALRARRADALRRLRATHARPVEPRPRLLPLQVHRGLPGRRRRTPEDIYVREDAVVPGLDGWLVHALRRRPHRRHVRRSSPAPTNPTADAEARAGRAPAAHRGLRPPPAELPRRARRARRRSPPSRNWIAETERERRGLEAAARPADVPGGKLDQDAGQGTRRRVAGHRRRARRRRRRGQGRALRRARRRASPTTPTDECRSRHVRVGLRFVSEGGLEPPRPCGH